MLLAHVLHQYSYFLILFVCSFGGCGCFTAVDTTTLQMCGMESTTTMDTWLDSVFLLFIHSAWRWWTTDGSRYKSKCVLSSTLEEYVCRDDPTPGQSLCITSMWCCIVFQSRADKIYAVLQVIGCSNLSLADFMGWMRNWQGFMWVQWQVYLGNSQWYRQVTQALSHIQCKAERQNVILEESVIQARARVMAVDCIMSILGLWDGPKSYEALEWLGLVHQAWHTGIFF
jgi:hypothetical protein